MGTQHRLTLFVLLAILAVPFRVEALTCSNPVGANTATPVDPKTIASYTTPAGTSQVGFVFSGIRTTTININSVTWGGVAMTPISAQAFLSPVATRPFVLVNPPPGTNNIVIDYSATPLADAAVVVVCSDADTASPYHDATSVTGTNSTVVATVANPASGEILLDFFIQDLLTSAPTEGADQTVLSKGTDTAELGYGSSQQPGAAGGDMRWTTGLSEQFSIQALAVKPAASSAVNFFKRRLAP
jgi:hypothetical protein